jgi:AcrR family transcriptional regulator
MTDGTAWHTRGMATGGSPAPCGLRARKKAHTREAIIDAAIDLFERKGFDATTVEDIAAAADVSPRTFFRYFDSKLDVVMASKRPDEESIAELVVARPAHEGPIEAVHQVLREKLGETLAESSPLMLRQYSVLMTLPSLRAVALEHFHEHQEQIAGTLATRLGVDEDALQPHVLAAATATTAWTVVDHWVAGGARPERLLPMLDEGFACLEATLEEAGPSGTTG